MDRVQHFYHNANRVSLRLFGSNFLNLNHDQMTTVEKAIKTEFEASEF